MSTTAYLQSEIKSVLRKTAPDYMSTLDFNIESGILSYSIDGSRIDKHGFPIARETKVSYALDPRACVRLLYKGGLEKELARIWNDVLEPQPKEPYV